MSKKKKITVLLIPKDISTEEKLVEEMNVGVNFYDKASKLKNEIKLFDMVHNVTDKDNINTFDEYIKNEVINQKHFQY